MIAALGSLASYALPKLMTFASKKLFSTPLGAKVRSIARAGGFQGIGKNIKNNYVRMMNGSYDDRRNPLQNAEKQQQMDWGQDVLQDQQQQWEDQPPPPPPPPKRPQKKKMIQKRARR